MQLDVIRCNQIRILQITSRINGVREWREIRHTNKEEQLCAQNYQLETNKITVIKLKPIKQLMKIKWNRMLLHRTTRALTH